MRRLFLTQPDMKVSVHLPVAQTGTQIKENKKNMLLIVWAKGHFDLHNMADPRSLLRAVPHLTLSLGKVHSQHRSSISSWVFPFSMLACARF